MMIRIGCFVFGYIFGNFPTGYLYAKAHGVDIRSKGSGNIGTTNVHRTLGAKAGIITLVGDVLKIVIPMIITGFMFKSMTDMRYIIALYTGMGAVIGHSYPFTLGFKGGKGVACMAGLIGYIGPVSGFPVLFVFLAVVALTKYVSLGSILVVVSFFILSTICIMNGMGMGWNGALTMDRSYLPEAIALTAFLMFFVIFRHRENIKRLMNGTENRFSLHKH